jgi:hypothetical protein
MLKYVDAVFCVLYVYMYYCVIIFCSFHFLLVFLCSYSRGWGDLLCLLVWN